MTSGIENALDGIDLGDKRLNARSKKLLENLFANPAASINAANHGWSETMAAYRLLDNDAVTPAKLLAPHQQATRVRVAQHPVVIFAQDTTELDFSGHPPKGSGPLNSLKQRGFLDHTQLAYTPEGVCLGVVDVDIWARKDEGFGDSKKRQHDPLETKEKFRWLQGYRTACDWQRATPDTRIISVSDSEGDIYELFTEVEGQGEGAAEFVIRSGKIRNLTELDPDAPNGRKVHRKLEQAAAEASILAVRRLELPRTPKREPRSATLEIRARRVELKPPYRKHSSPQTVEVNVVLVREVDPPPGVEPIEWLLLTTLPIGTANEVLFVVDCYTGRWPIEIFFHILKSGCRVERIQLETDKQVFRGLMMYKIVAWRIQYLTMLGRECPNLPCDALFTASEWKPVWKIVQKTSIPRKAPKLGEFLMMVGKLGGHNGRAKEAPPGPMAIWVGLRRMTDFAIAWQAFQAKPKVEPPISTARRGFQAKPKGEPPISEAQQIRCV